MNAIGMFMTDVLGSLVGRLIVVIVFVTGTAERVTTSSTSSARVKTIATTIFVTIVVFSVVVDVSGLLLNHHVGGQHFQGVGVLIEIETGFGKIHLPMLRHHVVHDELEFFGRIRYGIVRAREEKHESIRLF